jgi:hypothetical protein
LHPQYEINYLDARNPGKIPGMGKVLAEQLFPILAAKGKAGKIFVDAEEATTEAS